MNRRPGFMLYFELVSALSTMEDTEAGQLFKALMAYAQHGEVQPLAGLAAFAFEVVRPRIDRDNQVYQEKCRKSAYAAYVRDAQRRQETPLEYEDWCGTASDDIGRYPTTTTTAATTATAAAAAAESSRSRAAAPLPPVDYGEFRFSPTVKKRIGEWLRYKSERRETYTPTGMRSLLSQLDRHIARHGEEAVLELIGECMAAGYRGIVFDRLDKRSGEKQSGALPADGDTAWMEPYIRQRDKGRKKSAASERREP